MGLFRPITLCLSRKRLAALPPGIPFWDVLNWSTTIVAERARAFYRANGRHHTDSQKIEKIRLTLRSTGFIP